MASKKDMEETISRLRMEARNNLESFQRIQAELDYQESNSVGWMNKYHTEVDKRCLLEQFVLNCIYTQTNLSLDG